MKKKATYLPQLIENFFFTYLPLQRGLSPHTRSAYATTLSMLLKFLQKRKNIVPSRISVDDLSAENILEFLNYLEKSRKNCVKTRNARLAAIHSFVKYILFENPTLSGRFCRVLSIPAKRGPKKILDYLTRDEMNAILDSSSNSWLGQRDRTMFTVMYNTGIRVSEVTGLKVSDVRLEKNGIIRIIGKGRKERELPLWKNTTNLLKQWIKTNRLTSDSVLFPSSRGTKLTRSAIAKRLVVATKSCENKCKSLKKRKVTPHTLRHTMAMHFLQSGTDITVIAMWLGHTSIETTHMYIEADPELKVQALKALQSPREKRFLYEPKDSILELLDSM